MADAAADASATVANRVYIHNLPWGLTNAALAGHLGAAGTVRYASIMTHPDGRSKGCAIVEFGSPEEAGRAISAFNDTEIEGRKILIREDREGSGAPSGPRPVRGGRGGARGGATATRGAPRGGRGGASSPRGGAGGAPAAPRAPRPANVGAGPAVVGAPGTSLYVGNLAWSVSWQDLKDAFTSHGAIYADVKHMPNGRSKGWGIVRFNTADEALAALAAMNNADLKGRNIIVREDNGPKRREDGEEGEKAEEKAE